MISRTNHSAQLHQPKFGALRLLKPELTAGRSTRQTIAEVLQDPQRLSPDIMSKIQTLDDNNYDVLAQFNEMPRSPDFIRFEVAPKEQQSLTPRKGSDALNQRTIFFSPPTTPRKDCFRPHGHRSDTPIAQTIKDALRELLERPRIKKLQENTIPS